MKRKSLVLWVLAMVFGGVLADKLQAVEYSIIDLGTLGGMLCYPYDINANGQVVGSSHRFSGSSHAFLYSDGVMSDLNTLGGGQSSARGINNFCQVVGYSKIEEDSAYHAFLYSNGSMQDLGTLGGKDSYAIGINSKGEVAGYSQITSNEKNRNRSQLLT